MNLWKKVLLPLLVIAAGAALAVALIKSKPAVERQQTEVPPPLVEVIEAHRRDVTLDVSSQGSVAPRTESTLVAQVGGRIEKVSPKLEEGAFVERGQFLLSIERRDYELAVAQAEAAVATGRVVIQREEAEAALALEEWKELGRAGDPPPLVAREPQLAEARAALLSAEARLAQAQLDLERTTVRAPFSGRIRAKHVDLGQSVNPGTQLATIFADDFAEVRLPVPGDQLGFLDLGFGARPIVGNGPAVRLSAELGGRRHVWEGRVVRTAGAIDPQTRMLDVFARVEDPFQRRTGGNHGTPLPMGLFVEAEIAGRVAPGVIVAPRNALTPEGELMVVDGKNRLRFRPVEVLRTEGDTAVLGAGIEDGERILVSPLETPVDGMRVRTVIADEREQEEADGGDSAAPVEEKL